MGRVQKFISLPFRRKVLLLKCWCMLNLTALALRLLPLPTVLGMFGTNQPPATAPRTSSASSEDILWSIRAAAALSWKPTCAVRGLVAERLLRRAGFAAQFKLGVARRDEDFQAHAWVEGDKGILIGASEHEYHRLPDLDTQKLASRL